MKNKAELLEGVEITKTELVKPASDNDDWENDVYGFECANWTCKC